MTINMIHKEDPEDVVRCLECGRWYKTISRSHTELIHGMSQAEYMKKYNMSTIASHLSREKMSVSSRIIPDEEWAKFEIGSKNFTVRELAVMFGRTEPTIRGRLRKLGIKAQRLINRKKKWTKERLIQKIIEYHNNSIPLNAGYINKVDLALMSASRYVFGSWEKAVETAGLDYSDIKIGVRRDAA
ncbi:hypothetical protein HY605_00160 [Candidatus Peregrinibacteria bacterium]|nr:hypothetical protein [Candidatus Peregrinibacteria bacterium]